MSYVSLYRMYRPSNFNEISGQMHVVKTLKNAVINDKVSHAYLFSGPRGTGKTSIAKILAKAVNCLDLKDGNPCGECAMCAAINENRSSDVIEMDAASNSGVDDIRDLKEKVRFLPAEAKYKVYIIDEAHALSMKAFNALLKTLEEPPSYVIFVLATTEPYNIPQTILSRTQIFDFKGLEMNQIQDRIRFICDEKKVKIEDDAIHEIALMADGGMRDALSLLDQCISFTNGNVTVSEVNRISGSLSNELLIKLASSIIQTNPAASLTIIDEIIKDGKEISRIISDLTDFFKNLLLKKSGFENNSLLFKDSEFNELAKTVSNNRLYFFIDELANCSFNIKKTNQKRSFLETAIVKLSDYNENLQFDLYTKINELTKKIESLEANRTSGNLLKKESSVVDNKDEYITISDVEKVLNNSVKKNKDLITNSWEVVINNITTDALKRNLKTIEICAVSNDVILFAIDKEVNANRLMQIEMKKIIIEAVNKIGLSIKDYLVITKDNWNSIKTDFVTKFKILKDQQDKYVKLNVVDIKVKKYTAELDIFEPSIITEAHKLFPKEKIEIEE